MNSRLYKAIGWLTLLVILCLVPLFMKQNYVLHVLITIGVGVVLANSLRFVFLTGQLSLGHGAMVSLGAYFSSLTVMNLGLSFWLALPLAGVFAMIVSFFTGYLFTRLKGFYFAMVTMFLTMVVQLVAEQWRGLTGGVGGLTNIPPPNAIGALGFDSKADFYYLMLAIAVISLLIMYLLEFSRLGLTLTSVRDSEALAASVGVNTRFYKVLAFGLGGFFAGVVGSFYCHYYSAVSPSSFTFMLSIDVLVFMVVGGRHRFVGPILGAVVLTVIPELGRGMKEYEPFIYAAVLLLIIVFLPRGLISLPEQVRILLRRGTSPSERAASAITRGSHRA
ncbi:MAG: branched-chain amino acid ABC transporter permease [Actinomycetia bacterium]|nr:branched-chain amino acid ABC transporter permease [Actinomycetes bacterium]